ncbi:hypothetical protein [Pseudobacteriovorax antillogorgiicola]|uniref:Putative RNA methylase family UPF0020 n=1 Tax=Pseudobacteriovorax antillogorgiicola TaxID=1513793 RepID=A0A1Y6BHV7_9BACT|nr:hypothetical protein [Pseudobacteriovorax antillogorgiicola]TCS55547.1 putative RNA methylase family UPF0020 [Pseudobacteriovorax antillogorgiicola]SMF11125.1 Putative RNA methylase family UPF0020 [Pseudobacteriovorax antillogorgiicola]
MTQQLAIIISPEARGAYFHSFIKVAREELRLIHPDLDGEHRAYGGLDVLIVNASEEMASELVRLSFCQAVFRIGPQGWLPLAESLSLAIPRDYIFGSKFKGKTNERLTQMMLNVALALVKKPKPKVLDPMCGRGTSLLWAMAYGLECRGVEQDSKALGDVQQIVKKWNTVHDTGLKFRNGSVGKKSKQGQGRFFEVTHDETRLKMVIGDSQQANHLLQGEKFDVILADLPYGVQHFSGQKTRNPLGALEASASAWGQLANEGAALSLAFNQSITRKDAVVDLFEGNGWQSVPCTASHRMSESIVRDLVFFIKGA